MLICCKFYPLNDLVTFSNSNPYASKFDLGVEQFKVNPGSSFIINLVELESQMLHAKFQDHRTSRSGEEDF